jgi:hypothetical protein
MKNNLALIVGVVITSGISNQSDAQASRLGCPQPPYHAAGDTEPSRFRSSQTMVVVHQGKGGTPIVVGDNFLDQQRSIKCRSASGCLLTITTMVQGSDGYICALIDGFRANPFPPFMNSASDPVTTLQNVKVTTGSHTIQTDVRAANTGTLGSWEVNYTLYDGR